MAQAQQPLRRLDSRPKSGSGPIVPEGPNTAPLKRSTGPNLPLGGPVSTSGSMGGPMALAAGGVIDPTWRPPAPRPPAPPPAGPPAPQAPSRSFQTPQPPLRDPRLEALLNQLNGGSANGSSSTNPIAVQSAELTALLSQLMRGEGIKTPDLSNDPAAQAFALTKRREEERAREAEASALGASGAAGSGDFDGRVAQLREATGQSIAANNADLTNQRRGEALNTAITGAQLKLQDLGRQEEARRAEAALKSGDRAALLQVLMDREGRDADRYERELDRNFSREEGDIGYTRDLQERRYQEGREDPMSRLREELLKQDVETGKRRLDEDASRGRSRYGIRIPYYGSGSQQYRAPWQ